MRAASCAGCAARMPAMGDSSAQTYSGFTAAGAAASGLAAHDAASGLRDAGVTLGASFNITARTAVTGAIGYRKFLGSAADSPVVAVGDSGQMFATVGLNFSF